MPLFISEKGPGCPKPFCGITRYALQELTAIVRWGTRCPKDNSPPNCYTRTDAYSTAPMLGRAGAGLYTLPGDDGSITTSVLIFTASVNG